MAQSNKSGVLIKVKNMNILKKIFNLFTQKKSLQIITYNMNIQKRLSRDINNI